MIDRRRSLRVKYGDEDFVNMEKFSFQILRLRMKGSILKFI